MKVEARGDLEPRGSETLLTIISQHEGRSEIEATQLRPHQPTRPQKEGYSWYVSSPILKVML